MPDLAPVLEEALRELDCPGLLCAVLRDGEVRTWGAGTVGPADHGQHFPLYSITKTFTASAVLLLCERQRLSLDASFSSLLPGRPVPETITVRQLLNHTGGLSDYFASAAYREAVRDRPEVPWPYEELMRVGLQGTPCFAPGQGWSYSNPGYALLGELIEALSGKPHLAFVKEALLDPLDLAETVPFSNPDREGRFLRSGEADFMRRYDPGWILPGCLISTVTDVARFYDALLGGKILSSASLAAMTEVVELPYPLPAPMKASYGLGVMHAKHHPLGPSYGHGGGGPGYATYAVCYPDLGGAPLSFALVATKSLPATPFDLADRIAGAFI